MAKEYHIIAWELVQFHAIMIVFMGLFAIWLWKYLRGRGEMKHAPLKMRMPPGPGQLVIGSVTFLVLWTSVIVPGVPRVVWGVVMFWPMIGLAYGTLLVAVAVHYWPTLQSNPATQTRYVVFAVASALAYFWLAPWYFQGWAYESQTLIQLSDLYDERGRRLEAVFFSSQLATSGWFMLVALMVAGLAVWLTQRYKAWGALTGLGLIGLAEIIILFGFGRNMMNDIAGVGREFANVVNEIPTTITLETLLSGDGLQSLWSNWTLPWEQAEEIAVEVRPSPIAVPSPEIPEWLIPA